MSNVVQVGYTIAKRGLRARYNPLVRVYPSASPRVYTLTRGSWTSNPLLTIVYPIHISREISIEHPSVGLSSLAQLHGSACNMTRYFTSSDSIVTYRRRVEIQSKSEMSPYFTMSKCNKLFITYRTRSTERLPSLPSSILTISTISMTVVMTTLFKKR